MRRSRDAASRKLRALRPLTIAGRYKLVERSIYVRKIFAVRGNVIARDDFFCRSVKFRARTEDALASQYAANLFLFKTFVNSAMDGTKVRPRSPPNVEAKFINR